jgi:type IV pilus assembly protein PilE
VVRVRGNPGLEGNDLVPPGRLKSIQNNPSQCFLFHDRFMVILKVSNGIEIRHGGYFMIQLKEKGFTLVELMVVTSIIAILAAVATPAYINHQNRAKQTEAVEALLRAKMDQEAFWADNNRYANTIGCLYSFGNSCGRTSYLTSSSTVRSYTVSITGNGAAQVIRAQRAIQATGANDIVTITLADNAQPVVTNPTALHFSVFNWIFN